MKGLVGGPLLVGGLGPGPLATPPPINPALLIDVSLLFASVSCRLKISLGSA